MYPGGVIFVGRVSLPVAPDPTWFTFNTHSPSKSPGMTGRITSRSDVRTFSTGISTSVSSPVTTGPNSQIQNGVIPRVKQENEFFKSPTICVISQTVKGNDENRALSIIVVEAN